MRAIGDRRALGLLVGVVLAAYGLMAVALATTKVRVDFASLSDVYTIVGIIVGLAVYMAVIRARRLSACLFVVAACVLLVVPVAVWSYAAISLDYPLADQELATWDAALGFDWRSFVQAVDGHPLIANVLHYAYRSFTPQLFFVPLFFAARGDALHAFSVIAAYAMLCFVSSIISIWYPALGTYVTYGVGPGDLTTIDTRYGFFFLPEFNAVREASAFTLDFNRAAGILTFPSVHAGVAGLCAWGAWRSRLLRWPFLALNVAMAISAVSHANHYLVDVVAGLGLAVLSAAAATVLFQGPSRAGSPITRGITAFRGRSPVGSRPASDLRSELAAPRTP